MKIGAKKLEIGKWQFRLCVYKTAPFRLEGFQPQIIVHFAKFRQRPPEGEMAMKGRDYKGFIFDWVAPRIDIIITTKTFYIFRKRIVVPYKIKLRF
jgi:hypothetical protein